MRLNSSRIEGAALIAVLTLALSPGCYDPSKTTLINRPDEASFNHGDLATYSVGGESYTLSDLRTVYEWMLAAPDVLYFQVEIEGDLAPERLLRLAVTHGKEHTEPAQEHAEYVMPDLDFQAAVESQDPWVVSAALFLARKQQIDLDLGTLVVRWQSGQPWDEVCTEQAILYFAARSPQDFDQLPAGLNALERADPAHVEIRPWLFLSSAEWEPDLVLLEPGSGLVFEIKDSTMDIIVERPLARGVSTLVLPGTSNYYSFRYLDGPMHGESRFVDGKPGTFIRMAVAVNGGV